VDMMYSVKPLSLNTHHLLINTRTDNVEAVRSPQWHWHI